MGAKAIKGALPLLLLCLSFWAYPRIFDAIRAAFLLADFLAEGQQTLFQRLTSRPQRYAVAFYSDSLRIEADCYRVPGRRGYPGILLVHGLNEAGKDDERLIALAGRLARSGFSVLVPEFKAMKSFQIKLSEIDDIAASFDFLISQPDVARNSSGVVAFSFAVGPALLAAAKPRISGHVKFVVCFGGYYDLKDVICYLTTGYYRAGGRWHYYPPRPWAKWLFILANPDLITGSDNMKALNAIARLKSESEDADVSEHVDGLRGEGLLIYRILTNKDPNACHSLLDDLSPELRRYFDELSPARALANLRAAFILGHALDDDAIPYTESLKLFDHLRREGRQASLTLLRIYEHVDLKLRPLTVRSLTSFYLPEAFKLWRMLYLLLRQQAS